MDRREARAILESMKLIDFRFTPKSKATEALDLAIEALREKHQPPPETSTNGSYIRDGRLMHDLVYRGEAEVDKSTISKTETVDTDLISRQAAIEALGEEPAIAHDTDEEWAEHDAWVMHRNAIGSLPPVEPKQSKGEWIKSYFNECCGTDENHNPVFRKTPCVRCDQCGEKRRNEEKFCPNCGADMRGCKE